MCQFHSKILIVRPVSAVRPSSVTDSLRGRCLTISDYEMLLLLSRVNLEFVLSIVFRSPYFLFSATINLVIANSTFVFFKVTRTMFSQHSENVIIAMVH